MTPYLHGNGKPCPTCDGAGETRQPVPIGLRSCSRCKGTGIVARPIRTVIRDARAAG